MSIRLWLSLLSARLDALRAARDGRKARSRWNRSSSPPGCSPPPSGWSRSSSPSSTATPAKSTNSRTMGISNDTATPPA